MQENRFEVLRILIATHKLKRAFSEARSLLDNTKQLLLLEYRFSALRTKINEGTITQDAATTEQNQIVKAFQKHLQGNKATPTKKTRSSKSKSVF